MTGPPIIRGPRSYRVIQDFESIGRIGEAEVQEFARPSIRLEAHDSGPSYHASMSATRPTSAWACSSMTPDRLAQAGVGEPDGGDQVERCGFVGHF